MFRLRFALLLTLCSLPTAPASGQTVVTFEDTTLSQPLGGPGRFQNGRTLNPAGAFTTGGATFNNNYNSTFDSWSGWSYSNVTDTSTKGFGNQYAAYNVPGGGVGDGSANYALGYAFSPGQATIDLAPDSRPLSARVTNTTYAALSMRDGDAFAKQFGGASRDDPDFFFLTITGLNSQGQQTGKIDFYLADFRFVNPAQDYIVSEWTTVDLTSLTADTRRLSFGLTSSDVGAFGTNTPTYFAFDNLVIVPVPEPASVGIVAALGLGMLRVAGRRMRKLRRS